MPARIMQGGHCSESGRWILTSKTHSWVTGPPPLAQRSQGKALGRMTKKGQRLVLWAECEMTLWWLILTVH